MKKFFSYLQAMTCTVLATLVAYLIFSLIQGNSMEHYYHRIGNVIVPTIISFALIVLIREVKFFKVDKTWKNWVDNVIISITILIAIIAGVMYFDYAFHFNSGARPDYIEYTILGITIVLGMVRARYSIILNIIAAMIGVIIYAEADFFIIVMYYLSLATVLTIILRFMIFGNWGDAAENFKNKIIAKIAEIKARKKEKTEQATS